MQHRERSSASARDSLTSFDPTTASQPCPRFPRPRSKAFSFVLHQIERFAPDESITIVFEGESGTGKNWLARLAHQLSRRSARELHEKSLATVIDSLAGSELFGHEAGAFTDARTRRPGAFQSANHSTLFIDEIGKASDTVQRLLLRAIEDRVICPVGADRSIKVDVRLLMATNVSLKSLVAEQLFLPDLYARLGQFRVYLPPLRERKEDIPDLARYFLAHHALRRGYSVGLPTIHPSLMSALESAEWEYNLRELDGVMHRLIVEADSAAQLTPEHCVGDLDYLRVRSRGRPTKSSPASVAATVGRTDSIADAARALSVSRSTVYRKLAQLTSDPPMSPVAEAQSGE
jgi:DNA-binding NtrC family response regulator